MKFSTRQTPVRVAVLWHDTVTSELFARKAVCIGEDLRCDLVLPDVAGIGAKHLAFEPDNDGGWWFKPTAEMVGTLERGGKAENLDTARPVSLCEGDWGQVDLGAMSLFFRVGSEAVAVPGGATLATVSTPLLGSLTGALGVHLAILIGAFLLYDEDPQLMHVPIDERVTSFVVEAPQKPLPEKEIEAESMTEDVAKAPPEEEGSFGETKEAEKPTFKDNPKGTIVDRIKKSAVISALGRGPIRNVMGDKEGLINKLDQAMAGSDDMVVQSGGNGWGMKGLRGGGDGIGPGGKIGGRSKLGNLTGGRGRGTKSRLKKRKKRRITVVPQAPVVGGGFCKPSDIQRVVKLRARGVKFCYEKALGANPELSGQLSLSWRILPNGSVAKVRVEKSTLASKAVGTCVARVIKRWKFPKPDGGQCAVRYPFVFNSGL